MDNFQNYENERYQKAKTFKNSSSENFVKIIKSTLFFSSLNLFLIYEITTNLLFKIFCTKKVKNISGQVALVTGSANGLGREIACKLAQNKCDIAVVDLNIVEAQKTAEFIANTYNVKTKSFKVDISKFEEVEKLKFDIEKSLGPVDILVNNAGIMPIVSLREGKPEDVQKIIDVNLTSHFWVLISN